MNLTITIENLDQSTLEQLRTEAQRRGLSPDATARELLKEQLSVLEHSVTSNGRRENLRSLAGTWTDDQADEFNAAVADFERVEWELWK